jgi:hypothetical protein
MVFLLTVGANLSAGTLTSALAQTRYSTPTCPASQHHVISGPENTPQVLLAQTWRALTSAEQSFSTDVAFVSYLPTVQLATG